MKKILFLLLLGAAISAAAQTSFQAALTTASNSQVTGAAAFTVLGPAVRFTISINREQMLPTSAWLIGSQTTFMFDLGTPLITIHSPGPWPQGYDGSTAFFGSFNLPTALTEDFLAGRTVLSLRGTVLGDFSGLVLPAPNPQIASFTPQSAGFRLAFVAQPPYQYTVESSADLGMANVRSVTNVPALSQTFEVKFVDSIPATGTARFYRIRRDLCCDGK